MAKTQDSDDRRPDSGQARNATADVKPPAEPVVERRNLSSRRALLRRVRGEFLEMTGLTLTLAAGHAALQPTVRRLRAGVQRVDSGQPDAADI